jgi:hypothetical protein
VDLGRVRGCGLSMGRWMEGGRWKGGAVACLPCASLAMARRLGSCWDGGGKDGFVRAFIP